MEKTSWSDSPIDIDYLVNSGLLFEINRQIMHPFGIAMTVRASPDGTKSWGFVDNRAAPEKAVFTTETLSTGRAKLEKFLVAFGHPQMEKRRKRLGWAVQSVMAWVAKKREKQDD